MSSGVLTEEPEAQESKAPKAKEPRALSPRALGAKEPQGLTDCRVITSLPISSVDNSKAEKIIANVNEKNVEEALEGLSQQLHYKTSSKKKGLHLNARDIPRFSMKLLGRLNSLMTILLIL